MCGAEAGINVLAASEREVNHTRSILGGARRQWITPNVAAKILQ